MAAMRIRHAANAPTRTMTDERRVQLDVSIEFGDETICGTVNQGRQRPRGRVQRLAGADVGV
jgi:hypothetical protein